MNAYEGGLTRDGCEPRERRGEARERGPRPETKHERDEWHVERERERRATRRERATDERETRERARRDARQCECEGLVRVLIHARGKEREARRLY